MDVFTKEGNEFSSRAQLIAALTKNDLQESHVAYETQNGGWIGIPVGDERIEEKPKRNKLRVRVYRANCDDENRDLLIKVTANSPKQRKVFHPGEEVELTPAQLNILKDSVTTNEIQIESNSGIYSSKNPEVAAKNMYPGMQIRKDIATGLITAYRHLPNFIIEHVE